MKTTDNKLGLNKQSLAILGGQQSKNTKKDTSTNSCDSCWWSCDQCI